MLLVVKFSLSGRDFLLSLLKLFLISDLNFSLFKFFNIGFHHSLCFLFPSSLCFLLTFQLINSLTCCLIRHKRLSRDVILKFLVEDQVLTVLVNVVSEEIFHEAVLGVTLLLHSSTGFISNIVVFSTVLESNTQESQVPQG